VDHVRSLPNRSGDDVVGGGADAGSLQQLAQDLLGRVTLDPEARAAAPIGSSARSHDTSSLIASLSCSSSLRISSRSQANEAMASVTANSRSEKRSRGGLVGRERHRLGSLPAGGGDDRTTQELGVAEGVGEAVAGYFKDPITAPSRDSSRYR
jgi:hypothetical protein